MRPESTRGLPSHRCGSCRSRSRRCATYGRRRDRSPTTTGTRRLQRPRSGSGTAALCRRRINHLRGLEVQLRNMVPDQSIRQYGTVASPGVDAGPRSIVDVSSGSTIDTATSDSCLLTLCSVNVAISLQNRSIRSSEGTGHRLVGRRE